MKRDYVTQFVWGLFLTAFCIVNVKAVCVCNKIDHEVTAQISTTNPAPDVSNGDTCKLSPYVKSCKGIGSLRTTRKVVALTFDDGPSKKYTEEVLDILRAYNVKGTFFFVGKNILEYPEIVKTVYKEGHVIGNHSYAHYHLDRLSGQDIENELTKTSEIFYNLFGVYPRLFRPPYGSCAPQTVRVAKNLGLVTIMWSAITQDFRVDKMTSEKIAHNIISAVHPGAIICLHDGGGNRAKTVRAVQKIIEHLLIEGYQFLTVPELLNICPYRERVDK